MTTAITRCELCGKETPNLVRCNIEGTELKVCESCAHFGKILGRTLTLKETEQRVAALQTKKQEEAQEQILLISPNYASSIKQGRERLGLTQKEFALKISERESLLHQIESGHFKPSIELARKLEKILSISLVQEITDTPSAQKSEGQNKTSNSFVLGDFIKSKAKK